MAMAFFILRGLKEWGKKKKKKCGGFSNRKPKINPIRRNNKKIKKELAIFYGEVLYIFRTWTAACCVMLIRGD